MASSAELESPSADGLHSSVEVCSTSPIVQGNNSSLARNQAPSTASEATLRSPSVAIVKGEIHNVLALMRANARYSALWRFEKEAADGHESPLVRGFKILHDVCVDVNDLSDLDTVVWLRPFIDVVIAPETSGPITGGALESLSKFLLYDFISEESLRAAEAVNRIAFVVCRCRFESTDSAADEVVLTKILNVLVHLLRSRVGHLLTDQAIWEAMVTALGIARQKHLSELLRKSAEHCMTQILLTVFSSLPPCSSVEENAAVDLTEAASACIERPISEAGTALMSEKDDLALLDALQSRTLWPPHVEYQPSYGLPCMRRLLALICALTDPITGDEAKRTLGLTLVTVVLETCGPRMGSHPCLVTVLQGTLCKSLLQNSRTSSLNILSLTLRVVFDMFTSVREHMKVQLEVFFNSMHLALATSDSSSPLVKEMAMESLVEFCREPELVVGLYVNYDCDMQCTNLFERLVQFLAKTSLPSKNGLNSINLLAAEGMRAMLASICKEVERAQEAIREGKDAAAQHLTAEQIRERKRKKGRLHIAAESFNHKPKEGLAMFRELRLAESDQPTAKEVASFIKEAPGLDRTIVGDFLGDPADFNLEVLSQYSNSFDFDGLTFDEALRQFLEGFRLPGEAQKIDRIMKAFASSLFKQSPGPMANEDAAYVLGFSVIMLNTDVHNKQVRHKMTKEQFIRNNRGINDGQDFPQEYLSALYDSIFENEIKLKDDLTSTDSAISEGMQAENWDDLLTRSKSDSGQFQGNISVLMHLRDLFAIMWKEALHSFCVVFETTTNRRVLDRTLECLESLTQLASQVESEDAINSILVSMHGSMLRFVERSATGTHGLRALVSTKKVVVGAIVWLKLARRHVSVLRRAWDDVVTYLLALHALEYLPDTLVEMDDFTDSDGQILPNSFTENQTDQEQSQDAGMLSSLMTMLWAPGESSQQQQQQNVAESDNKAVFIQQLDLASLLSSARAADPASVHALLLSLCGQARKTEYTYAQEEGKCVFCLEFAVSLVLGNIGRLLEHTVEEDSSDSLSIVMGLINEIISNCLAPSLLMQRAVVNLLRIAIRASDTNGPSSKKVISSCLNTLASARESSKRLQGLENRVVFGVGQLMRISGNVITDRRDWETIFSLLNAYIADDVCKSSCWETVNTFLSDSAAGSVNGLNADLCIISLRLFLDDARQQGSQQSGFHLVKGAIVQSFGTLHSRLNELRIMTVTSSQDNADKVAFVQEWTQVWLVTLQACFRMVDDTKHPDVTSHALNLLETVLLSDFSDPETSHSKAPLTSEQWKLCFQEVLFPSLAAKFENHGSSADTGEKSDSIKLRVLSLICKTFMSHIKVLASSPDFSIFWLKFLSMLTEWKGKLAGSKAMEEAMLQVVQNMVVVLYTQGAFQDFKDNHGTDVWELTWTFLGSLSTEMKQSLQEAGLAPDGEGLQLPPENQQIEPDSANSVVTEATT